MICFQPFRTRVVQVLTEGDKTQKSAVDFIGSEEAEYFLLKRRGNAWEITSGCVVSWEKAIPIGEATDLIPPKKEIGDAERPTSEKSKTKKTTGGKSGK